MNVTLSLDDQQKADLRERVRILAQSKDYAGLNINEYVTMLVISGLQKPESAEG